MIPPINQASREYYHRGRSLSFNLLRYETVVKRWPVIITGVVDWVHNECHQLAIQLNGSNDAVKAKKLEEGKAIMEKVSKLKYEMARDKSLECVRCSTSQRRDLILVKTNRGRWRVCIGFVQRGAGTPRSRQTEYLVHRAVVVRRVRADHDLRHSDA